MPNPSGTPETSGFEGFVDRVWRMGEAHARNNLPWRFVDDPYGVYVSEVMLQQTQVQRVLEYWPSWMSRFPTLDALASASASDVLDHWQGLGYNRRALGLKRTAEWCSSENHGMLPGTVAELLSLPGIGPATAAGIVAFAYQRPSVYIETNVRSVYIHHFFSHVEGGVSDKDIAPLVEATCSMEHPREWYYALLDYGFWIKRNALNPSRKSAAHTRQSAFEGSDRQKRSFILREVLAEPGIALGPLKDLLDESEESAGRGTVDPGTFARLVEQLSVEGFFSIVDGRAVP